MLPEDCRMILQGGMVLLTMVSDTLINDLPPTPGLLYDVQGERALLLHMGNILPTHKSTKKLQRMVPWSEDITLCTEFTISQTN